MQSAQTEERINRQHVVQITKSDRAPDQEEQAAEQHFPPFDLHHMQKPQPIDSVHHQQTDERDTKGLIDKEIAQVSTQRSTDVANLQLRFRVVQGGLVIRACKKITQVSEQQVQGQSKEDYCRDDSEVVAPQEFSGLFPC